VPDIRWVAEIGAVADPGAAPARPYYLRPADARPQESGRIARR
jgi:tRNA threonylcarbamoyladenosine biosynthesis protein TsaB